MNYSKQRELILQALKNNVVHPSAEYLYNVLKKEHPSISLATVYRNLNKLAENGIIKKIEGLDGCDHFDHNTFAHYHLLCLKCGQIFDVPESIAPDICKKLTQELGFDVLQHEITFRGFCPQCKEKLKESA